MLPHTLVGLGLLTAAVSGSLIWLGVLLLGNDMQGQVVRKSESHGGRGGPSYVVHYAFRLDGVEYTDRVNLGTDDYARVQQGQPIDVRVLAWMPQRGHWPRLPGYWALGEMGKWWLIALFWNGILSVFLWQAYVRPWFQRRLLRHGVPTTGVVSAVRWWSNRGTRCVKVRYQYTRAPGDEDADRVYTGSVTATGQGAAVQIGERLTVLYDPRRPHWSVPYRLADYQVPAREG
jgi:hypothetical protein